MFEYMSVCPTLFTFFFWFCTFSHELTLIMNIHIQCLQDNGVIVILSQVTLSSHVCKQHCSSISGHMNTYTSYKVLQVQVCRNVLSFKGVGRQGGHIDSWLIHPLHVWLDLISLNWMLFESIALLVWKWLGLWPSFEATQLVDIDLYFHMCLKP